MKENIVLRCSYRTFVESAKGESLGLRNVIVSSDRCIRKDIQIVPIVVGDITKEQELEYGRILAPYLAEEGTVFIASSDFCHWSVHVHTLFSKSMTIYFFVGARSMTTCSIYPDPIALCLMLMRRPGPVRLRKITRYGSPPHSWTISGWVY
jgi:AmmeMemoRadiSam system protein B